MVSSFSLFELRVINSFICEKSFAEIAGIIERSVDDVSEVVMKIASTKNIITYQQKLNERKPVGRPKKETNPKVTSAIIRPVKDNRIKRVEPKFQTKVVDYSQMLRLQVDAKTWIYIKPGEDAAAAKAKYLKRLSADREILSTQAKQIHEVKKFKPLK